MCQSPLYWKNKSSAPLPLFIFCAFLLNFCFSSELWAGSYPQYNITATLDLPQKKIIAEQTVTYTNQSDASLPELFFHIYPHREYSQKERNFMLRYSAYFKVNPYPDGFETGDLNVTAIRQGDNPLAFTIEGEDKTLLKVPLQNALAPGQTVELTINFAVEIPHAYGRFGWHEDIVKLSRWYPLLSVHDERGWHNHPFYPFHRPFFSEASLYSLQLTVPQQQTVIHSGELVSARENADQTKTLSLKSALPIREFSLAMSPQYKLVEEDWQGIKIKSYYLPGDDFYAKQALGVVKDVMGYYTQRLGPYPYKEFSVAPVHLGYGGGQMSNMIFMDTRVYQLPRFLVRYFDFLVSHETGHQWFYNMVGMDEFTEMWLEEGVNCYFGQEYLENKYGKNGTILEFPRWMEKWKGIFPELTFKRTRDVRYKIISRIKRYDHPAVDKLSSFQEPSSIFSVTYGKGTRIVEMLRDQLGEEAFDRVFARILAEFKFRNLSVENFIRLCEAESKKDLSEFFEPWLYTDKKLDYAVKGMKGSSKNSVVVVNKGGIRAPLEVELTSRRGEKWRQRLRGSEGEEVIEVKEPVKSVVLDPDKVYLDIDRTNNSWPRKINVKAVPVYWPLYDISVFLPDDGYNLVAGPEIISNGLGAKVSLQKPYDQIFYAATGYEFNEQVHISRGGYQLNNVLNTQTALGFEIANRTDLEDGSEDLVSAKAYVRRELWPAKYGLTDVNDHVSLYLIRNRGLDGALALGEREDSRNISYLRRDEAIIGTAVHLGRSGPYPDPREGFNVDGMVENSGHFLGATQYFYRTALDAAFYQPLTPRSKLAYRAKIGLGYPDNKNLFELGGWNGLRGYDRKTNRGSHVLLGGAEYRFPLFDKIHMKFFDNIFGLESIGGVVFFDAGQNWFSNFRNSDLKKDAGVGLRFTANIGSFLEKVIIRVDAAQAINDADDDTHFWFGINHAF